MHQWRISRDSRVRIYNSGCVNLTCAQTVSRSSSVLYRLEPFPSFPFSPYKYSLHCCQNLMILYSNRNLHCRQNLTILYSNSNFHCCQNLTILDLNKIRINFLTNWFEFMGWILNIFEPYNSHFDSTSSDSNL